MGYLITTFIFVCFVRQVNWVQKARILQAVVNPRRMEIDYDAGMQMPGGLHLSKLKLQ